MSPQEGLHGEIVLPGGRRLRLRPVGLQDEAALVEMAARSTLEDLRLRFLGSIRPHLGTLSSKLAHVDQDRHVALAACDPEGPNGPDEILGVVRLVRADDARQGEFAIMVRSDLKGMGLGRALMREMLRLAADRGLARVEGEILRENRPMLRLARALGAKTQPSSGDHRTIRVAFDL